MDNDSPFAQHGKPSYKSILRDELFKILLAHALKDDCCPIDTMYPNPQIFHDFALQIWNNVDAALEARRER